MQLQSFYVDASVLASDVALGPLLTQLFQKKSGKVTFVLSNEGISGFYVETAQDILAGVRSAIYCEPLNEIQVGPYEWPDNIPWLHSLLGAKTKVTPIWEE
jgi:hypothetical protein